MAIYLKYGSIKGDATHQDHKDWIDCQSLQFGVGRAVSTPVGSAKNREASEPSVSEVTITKLVDAASTYLFEESVVGNDGKDLEVHLVATGSPGVTYATFKMSNALVSGYSISTGGDRPTELVSFNFTKIEFKNTPMDDKGKLGSPVVASYDLVTTKKG